MIFLPHRRKAFQASVPSFGSGSRAFTDNDYVTVPASTFPGAAFSISWWEKATSGNQGYFFSDSDDILNLFFRWFNGPSGYDCRGTVGDENIVEIDQTQAQWNHNVLTHTSGGAWEWWHNNVSQRTGTGSNFTGLTSSVLYIGNRAGQDRDYVGNLADFRIYSDVLSDTEVGDLNGFTHVSGSLEGWYFLDTDDVEDHSGNGRDGTDNATAFSTDGPAD